MPQPDEIARRIGAPESLSSEELRSWIRKKLKEIHPDANNGEFKLDSRPEFDRLVEALSDLDQPSTSLTITAESFANALAPLIEKQASLTREGAQAVLVDKKEVDLRRAFAAKLKERYATRKYGSATFAAFFAALLTFPNTVLENQLVLNFLDRLPRLAENDAIIFVLFPLFVTGLVTSGYFFLRTWRQEKEEIAFTEHFMTDERMGDVARHLKYGGDSTRRGSFSLRDVSSALQILGVKADDLFLGQLADLMVERMIQKGIAEETTKGSIYRRFQLSLEAQRDVGLFDFDAEPTFF